MVPPLLAVLLFVCVACSPGGGDEQSVRSPSAEIAREISAGNDEDDTYLSIVPIDASGDCVIVSSPWSKIQEARDVVFAAAIPRGFGV